MSFDRVPIPTIAGLVNLFADRSVLLPGSVGNVIGAQLNLQQAPSGGPLTIEFANETGAGGTRQSLSVPDGAFAARGSLSIPLSATQTLYMSVTAENGSPLGLSGFIEFEGVGGAYTALCTLANVKRRLGIPDSDTTNDVLLTDLINAVSTDFINAVGRNITQTVVTGEKVSGDRYQPSLAIKHYPILALTEMRLDGSALDLTDYTTNDDAGLIFGSFASGRQNYELDYTGGYATVPDDIVSGVAEQVCVEYLETVPGGARRGVGSQSDEGGTALTYEAARVAPMYRRAVGRYRRYV